MKNVGTTKLKKSMEKKCRSKNNAALGSPIL